MIWIKKNIMYLFQCRTLVRKYRKIFEKFTYDQSKKFQIEIWMKSHRYTSRQRKYFREEWLFTMTAESSSASNQCNFLAERKKKNDKSRINERSGKISSWRNCIFYKSRARVSLITWREYVIRSSWFSRDTRTSSFDRISLRNFWRFPDVVFHRDKYSSRYVKENFRLTIDACPHWLRKINSTNFKLRTESEVIDT